MALICAKLLLWLAVGHLTNSNQRGHRIDSRVGRINFFLGRPLVTEKPVLGKKIFFNFCKFREPVKWNPIMMGLWKVHSPKSTLIFFTLNPPDLHLTTDKIRISRFSTFLVEMETQKTKIEPRTLTDFQERLNSPVVLLSASLQGPVVMLPVQPLCLRQSKLSTLELVQPHILFVKSQGYPQDVSSELSEQSLSTKSHLFFKSIQGPFEHVKHVGEVGVGEGVGRPDVEKKKVSQERFNKCRKHLTFVGKTLTSRKTFSVLPLRAFEYTFSELLTGDYLKFS